MNLIYDKSQHALAFDNDHVGREYLRLRHELRFLVEQASVDELQSVVRMLIRSGSWSEEKIFRELTTLVGPCMDRRVFHAVDEGMCTLWEDDGEQLYLLGE